MNRKIDWDDEEIISVITNPYLTLSEMANILGVNYYHLSKKRKELGLSRVYFGCYGHKSTSSERIKRHREKVRKLKEMCKKDGNKGRNKRQQEVPASLLGGLG